MKTPPSASRSIRPFRTVLVTTDFSAIANQALAYAGILAPATGRIIALTVQHPRALDRGEFHNPIWTPEARARHALYLEECRNELARLTRQACGRRLVETLVVESASVVKTINRIAQERAVDVLCLASHGYTGFRATILGSVARSVLTSSPCPVLIVRGTDGG